MKIQTTSEGAGLGKFAYMDFHENPLFRGFSRKSPCHAHTADGFTKSNVDFHENPGQLCFSARIFLHTWIFMKIQKVRLDFHENPAS